MTKKDTTSLTRFWTVDNNITPERVASELEDMYTRGIEEVVVVPGCGIATDAWLEVFVWCVREAKTRGMLLCIADGAGSSFRSADPEYGSKCLEIDAIPKSEIDVNNFEPGQFLIAGRIQGGQITRTRTVQDMITLRALDNGWHIFNCRIKRDLNYIDVLSRTAVDRLRDLTLERYRWKFRQELGKTIKAVFADEPRICENSCLETWTIPYTDKLVPSFEERYGYSPIPGIPYLFFPGRDAQEFRTDFWEHVAWMFNTNYHENLAQWCRDNGLLYTGRIASGEPLRCRIGARSDTIGIMKRMDLPCIDYPEVADKGSQSMSLLDLKIASSQAHIAGKPRAASESFRDLKGNEDCSQLKREIDWQFALGINAIIPHGLPQECESLYDYLSRLQEILTGGRHLCHVLILCPLSGVFAAHQPNRKTDEFECIDSVLNSLCLDLIKRQIDFDIVDFPTLSKAKIEEGKIALGDEHYEHLIIPYTPYMRPREYETIGRIAKSVGTYFFHRSMDPVAMNAPSRPGGVQFVTTEDLPGFVMRLRHAIDDGVHLSGLGREDILLLQREKDGQRLAFMVNRSNQSRRITARFAGAVGLVMIDVESGEETSLQAKSVQGKSEVSLHFAPNQSIIVASAENER